MESERGGRTGKIFHNISENWESLYDALVCCDTRKMLIGDSAVGSEMTNACSPLATDLPGVNPYNLRGQNSIAPTTRGRYEKEMGRKVAQE
ncbi:hypothetical protein Trydic_g7944 [Trypoxylus dichotomus]